MRFVSTRGKAPAIGFSRAIREGVAPDGGLYVPEAMPGVDPSALRGDRTLASFAAAMLAPFFVGDPLEGALAAICAEAFDFPVPLVAPDPARPALRALELFHGPTGSFKDFGARFLMACVDRLDEPLTILTATSGDTGGAVGCAAERRDGAGAVILYPKGRVSPFQQLQLTCWDDPVRALEVDGDFDDCQRLAKAAFADAALSRAHNLTSANSINIGRLLPQTAHIAAAAQALFEETGERPGFLVPSGNLGHGVAALMARSLGFPVGPVVLVTNANRALLDWHRDGRYAPASSLRTLANAMDVGAPNNFERLLHMASAERAVAVERVDDAAIRRRIREDFTASGYAWCPHSATAAEAYVRLEPERREERAWIACATAHPYKFREVVEPLTGETLAPPPALAAILGRPSRSLPIPATCAALAAALNDMAADRTRKDAA